MRELAPAGFRGDQAREAQVLNALFPTAEPQPRGHAGPLRDHQEPARVLMSETINLGEIIVALTRKDVKNVHLSVHPPDGRVTLVTPEGTRREVARTYAASKLGWIRNQQAKLLGQLTGYTSCLH